MDRDLAGYGQNPPHPKWPQGARIALQFVINYEEGGENTVLNGDSHSEAFLSEIVGAQAYEGVRHMNMESIYEYGSRAGFWRLHRLFSERQLPVTVFAVAKALELNPAVVDPMLKSDWEIASHGYRWIDYQFLQDETEWEHLEKAIDIHKKLTGEAPKGWYTGRTSPNSIALAMKYGEFRYCADSYADDLPYWLKHDAASMLMVPYTLDSNDMRFATAQGFHNGEQFFQYLKDGFDTLYDEGEYAPKMFSIGLHCRLIGRPARLAGLKKFLDYIETKPDVWVARRLDIAEHWHKHHPLS